MNHLMKTVTTLTIFPERGSYSMELLALGIKDRFPVGKGGAMA